MYSGPQTLGTLLNAKLIQFKSGMNTHTHTHKHVPPCLNTASAESDAHSRMNGSSHHMIDSQSV